MPSLAVYLVAQYSRYEMRKMNEGHERKYSIYFHSSREKPVHMSPLFIGRDIRSEKVVWGRISMVDAEKRLLANALQDTDNQHFILLSDSCIPLRSFDYVYNYLMKTNVSFIDCYDDPGPHGTAGRYTENMLPEIREEFRKGSQAVLNLQAPREHLKEINEFKTLIKTLMMGNLAVISNP